MSRLLDEILKDPDAVFEIDADLPSGNHMYGTVGPMIGANLAASIRFRNEPVAEDVQIARDVIHNQLGKPELEICSHSPDEHMKAARKLREFMGGGQG